MAFDKFSRFLGIFVSKRVNKSNVIIKKTSGVPVVNWNPLSRAENRVMFAGSHVSQY